MAGRLEATPLRTERLVAIAGRVRGAEHQAAVRGEQAFALRNELHRAIDMLDDVAPHDSIVVTIGQIELRERAFVGDVARRACPLHAKGIELLTVHLPAHAGECIEAAAASEADFEQPTFARLHQEGLQRLMFLRQP